MTPEWLTWVTIASFGVGCFALGGSVTFLILTIQRRIRP